MFQKIKSILSKGNRAQWFLFALFALTIFLQCCLFHWLAFHSILISSLWKNPMAFWAFYLPKISISLFIASFVFLFKRKSWTIVVSILINIWIIAELIYFRANRIFLDAQSFALISNMDGFWSSVPMYMYASDLILLLPNLLLILCIITFASEKRSTLSAIVIIGLALVANIGGCLATRYVYDFLYKLPHDKNYFNPFSDKAVGDLFGFTSLGYAKNTSVIHAFIYDIKKLIQLPFESTAYTMTDEEAQQLEPFINTYVPNIQPDRNLILIIVESLETWAIRPEIMPNLWKFMEEHNVLWAQHVESQTKGGTSSDGQLIFNTGLLPIQHGAVCKRYPHNVYPSLSDVYDHAALVQPGDLSVWNQKYMSDSYQIDTNYLSPQSLDHVTFSILDSIYNLHPYCMAITMATHSPFLACSKMTKLDLPYDMPENMANYLRCMHYSDSCWGDFLNKVDNDSILQNATICFMGDHIIFDPNMRNTFAVYCTDNQLDYDVNSAHTTIITYSPNIDKKYIVSETSYQMDAYPTILHLIGCENYYWKGFGVNLLDSVARNNRLITEQEAYMLSDKIIRANWFESYTH